MWRGLGRVLLAWALALCWRLSGVGQPVSGAACCCSEQHLVLLRMISAKHRARESRPTLVYKFLRMSVNHPGISSCTHIQTTNTHTPLRSRSLIVFSFTDDLVADQVLTRHDEALDAFVIQWSNMMAPAGKLPLGTFQAYLFPNGTVGYVYRDLYGTEQALGSSAVIGEATVSGRIGFWLGGCCCIELNSITMLHDCAMAGMLFVCVGQTKQAPSACYPSDGVWDAPAVLMCGVALSFL